MTTIGNISYSRYQGNKSSLQKLSSTQKNNYHYILSFFLFAHTHSLLFHCFFLSFLSSIFLLIFSLFFHSSVFSTLLLFLSLSQLPSCLCYFVSFFYCLSLIQSDILLLLNITLSHSHLTNDSLFSSFYSSPFLFFFFIISPLILFVINPKIINVR